MEVDLDQLSLVTLRAHLARRCTRAGAIGRQAAGIRRFPGTGRPSVLTHVVTACVHRKLRRESSEMPSRGRIFAAGALLVLVAQLTAVLAAPLVACAMTASIARGDSVDCCPAGSHPPGQCPLHRRESRSDDCRLTCARQGSTPFVPGFVGVLPPSTSIAPVILVVPAVASFVVTPIARSLTPASPPPRSLA